MACSQPNCPCPPDAPLVGSPEYGSRRAHVDAGDLDALRLITIWVAANSPCLHIRFADGEFDSILGQSGTNTDGQDYQSGTLGKALHTTLHDLQEAAKHDRNHLLIGGDWTGKARRLYMEQQGLLDSIPWCPSQIFVNGLVSGDTLLFLEAVRQRTGHTYLVANRRVLHVAPSLQATPIEIPQRNAWDGVPAAKEVLLAQLGPGDLVLYAGGMAMKPLAYDLWQHRPDTAHIDVGCLFDPAVGIYNRSWSTGTPDARLLTYRERYVPWLQGH